MATGELAAGVTPRGDEAVIALTGDIDSSAEGNLMAAYDEAVRISRSIVLDFSQTAYINSTGIALIVGLLAQARAHGAQITASGLSPHYREIFEITRLADFMTIVDGDA